MLKKLIRYTWILLLISILATSCARGPKVKPQPKPEKKPALPPVPSGFVMKSYQRAMSQEMRKSYQLADEIIIGVFSGTSHGQKDGLIYYFNDFSRFNKEMLSWEPLQNVILQVRADKLKPEIIKRNEFSTLIDLDKIGICWDWYQGSRSIYLVEGKENLIFLEFGFDEASSQSYWNLLDAYPVTKECRAKDVFNLMIRDLYSK